MPYSAAAVTRALTLDLVGLALLASITPLGVLGVFAVTGNGRRRNGVWYVGGWMSVLAVLAVLGAFVLHGAVDHETTPSRVLNAGLAILGALMVLGAPVLRRRMRAKAAASEGDGGRLQRVGPRAAFVAGVAMAPYPVGVAAGAGLMQTDASAAGRLVGLLLFVVLCTWPMIGIVVSLYAGGPSLLARLDRWHAWVEAHRADILAGLLVLLGLSIGIPGLVTAITGG